LPVENYKLIKRDKIMKNIVVLLFLFVLFGRASAQVEIFNQIGEYPIYHTEELRIFDNNIYYADRGYYSKILNSNPQNIGEVLNYKSEVFGNPKYFNIYGMFNSSDSLLILSTNNAVFVRRHDKWSEFEDSTSVLNQNAMQRFAMSGDTVVMYAQNIQGPYFLIGDSIYKQKFEFGKYDRLWNNAFKLVSLNHKFYYISPFFDLIEFDMDSYHKYEKKLFADDPEWEHFQTNAFLSVSQNKIWFSSTENYIITFDGEKFERNDVVRNYIKSKEELRYLRHMVVDLQGNIWFLCLVKKDGITTAEIIRIDPNNNITVPIRSTDPDFFMEIKGISALEVDQSDPTNTKLYIDINHDYIGIYDPVTDVLEVERIAQSFEVFPNPASDIINIKISEEMYIVDAKITLFDVTGKIVLSKDISDVGDAISLQINNIRAGCYFLKLETAEEVYNTKVIIQ
jgi:type IX secretion system substrate protein